MTSPSKEMFSRMWKVIYSMPICAEVLKVIHTIFVLICIEKQHKRCILREKKQ